MPEKSKDSIFDYAREAREVTKVHSATEQGRTSIGLPPWLSFETTLVSYVRDFQKFFPDIISHITQAQKRAEKEGRQMLIVDVGGALHVHDDNALTICITLTNPHLAKAGGRTIIVEDVLSKRGLRALEEAIIASGQKISLAFFNPQGGASLYAHNPIAYAQIQRVFKLLSEYLVDGGEVYGGVRFSIANVSFKAFEDDMKIEHSVGEIESGRIFHAFRMCKVR